MPVTRQFVFRRSPARLAVKKYAHAKREEDFFTSNQPAGPPCGTLLVYLGGDNNLDAETYDKLVQIKNGWQDGTDGKIIVYQDTPFKDSPRLMEIDGKSEKGYITIHTYDQ